MCIICVEFQKQLITTNEAWGILSEMSSGMDMKHYAEVFEMLSDAEEDD